MLFLVWLEPTLLLTTRTRPILSTVSFDILISEVSYIAEYILTRRKLIDLR